MSEKIKLEVTIEGDAKEIIDFLYANPEMNISQATLSALAENRTHGGSTTYSWHKLNGLTIYSYDQTESKKTFSQRAKADARRLGNQARIDRKTEDNLNGLIDELNHIMLAGME